MATTISEVTPQSSVSGRGIVIFDSRFGNTEKIARSLEAGLKRAGVVTICINAKEVSPKSLKDYDLVAVGPRPNGSPHLSL